MEHVKRLVFMPEHMAENTTQLHIYISKYISKHFTTDVT